MPTRLNCTAIPAEALSLHDQHAEVQNNDESTSNSAKLDALGLSPEELRLKSYNSASKLASLRTHYADFATPQLPSTTVQQERYTPLLELFHDQLSKLGTSTAEQAVEDWTVSASSLLSTLAASEAAATSSPPVEPIHEHIPANRSNGHSLPGAEGLADSLRSIMTGIGQISAALQQIRAELNTNINLARQDFPHGIQEAFKAGAAALDTLRGGPAHVMPASASATVAEPDLDADTELWKWTPESIINRRRIRYDGDPEVEDVEVTEYLVHFYARSSHDDIWCEKHHHEILPFLVKRFEDDLEVRKQQQAEERERLASQESNGRLHTNTSQSVAAKQATKGSKKQVSSTVEDTSGWLLSPSSFQLSPVEPEPSQKCTLCESSCALFKKVTGASSSDDAPEEESETRSKSWMDETVNHTPVKTKTGPGDSSPMPFHIGRPWLQSEDNLLKEVTRDVTTRQLRDDAYWERLSKKFVNRTNFRELRFRWNELTGTGHINPARLVPDTWSDTNTAPPILRRSGQAAATGAPYGPASSAQTTYVVEQQTQPVPELHDTRAPPLDDMVQPQIPGSYGAPLADYQMQLMLLEQQNKRRLLLAKQEQEALDSYHTSQPAHTNRSYMPAQNNPGVMNSAVNDYQMQLMLLEQQNKRRLLRAKQEQGMLNTSQPYSAPVVQSTESSHTLPYVKADELSGMQMRYMLSEQKHKRRVGKKKERQTRNHAHRAMYSAAQHPNRELARSDWKEDSPYSMESLRAEAAYSPISKFGHHHSTQARQDWPRPQPGYHYLSCVPSTPQPQDSQHVQPSSSRLSVPVKDLENAQPPESQVGRKQFDSSDASFSEPALTGRTDMPPTHMLPPLEDERSAGNLHVAPALSYPSILDDRWGNPSGVLASRYPPILAATANSNSQRRPFSGSYLPVAQPNSAYVAEYAGGHTEPVVNDRPISENITDFPTYTRAMHEHQARQWKPVPTANSRPSCHPYDDNPYAVSDSDLHSVNPIYLRTTSAPTTISKDFKQSTAAEVAQPAKYCYKCGIHVVDCRHNKVIALQQLKSADVVNEAGPSGSGMPVDAGIRTHAGRTRLSDGIVPFETPIESAMRPVQAAMDVSHNANGMYMGTSMNIRDRGRFPGTYVESIDDPSRFITVSDTTPQASMSAPAVDGDAFNPDADSRHTPRRATVIRDYKAEDLDELHLFEDDVIFISFSTQSVEDEYWYGQNQEGESGLFPKSHVVLLPSVDDPVRANRVTACVEQLREMGFGANFNVEGIADAANGDLEFALEIIEEATDENEQAAW